MAPQISILAPDGAGSLTAADRKRIRSYCMKGKNVKPNSRRSRRRAKQEKAARETSDGQYDGEGQAASTPTPLSLIRKPLVFHATSEEANSSSPSRFNSNELSLVGFPQDFHGLNGDLVYKYFCYDIIKSTMHPLQHVVAFTPSPILSLQQFLEDPAFLHSVLLTTSVVDDYIHHRPLARPSRYHLHQSLVLLNERLGDEKAYLNSSILYIVISLAFVAAMLGDYDAAAAHMDGAWKVIRLRGGTNPKLNVKLLQMDLWIALLSDREKDIIRMRTPNTWKPLPTSAPGSRLASVGIDYTVASLARPQLSSIYYDLQDLTIKINGASNSGPLVEEEMFNASIASIQGRLLHYEPITDNLIAEALRLGMLAFMTTMFRIPGEKIPLQTFSGQLKTACLSLRDTSNSGRQAKILLFWLLMVGLVSVFDDADEPWIMDIWASTISMDINNWTDANLSLQEIMWMNCLHDQLGAKKFDRLMRKLWDWPVEERNQMLCVGGQHAHEVWVPIKAPCSVSDNR